MEKSRPAQPVAGPRAFEENTADARLSQAAVVLSAAAAVSGVPVEDSEQFPLPDQSKLRHVGKMSVAEAVAEVWVDRTAYLRGETGVVSQDEAARLAHRLYNQPDPAVAAGLAEAALHSRYRLLRTAGAAAALETTGPRQDVIAVLEDSATADDPTVRDLARTALARVEPDHPLLQRLAAGPAPIHKGRRLSHTAVLTHGTFAASARWWQPGGDFYQFLAGINPPLNLHGSSFRWSGIYSDAARQLAAQQLGTWLSTENLGRPDLFAHSHGATVANLATQGGLQFDRLVLLAWPVHGQWLPNPNRVGRVIDVRVRFDLVILADLGGQRLPATLRGATNVEEHINGWFRHSAPHEPGYWQLHQLPDRL